MGTNFFLVAYIGVAAAITFIMLFGESVWMRGTIVEKIHWYITVRTYSVNQYIDISLIRDIVCLLS